MKQQTKWFAVAAAVLSGLAMANSVQAQTISSFQNFTPTVTYANWDQDGWMPINGGAGIVAPTLTSGTTPGSFEVNAGGYGSLHYDIPLVDQQIINPLAMYAVLTFTFNSQSNPGTTAWLGSSFLLDDNAGGSGGVSYGGYAGVFGYTGTGTAVWTGNTLTETVPITGTTLAAAGSGGSIIGFNVQLDPAIIAGSTYDLTFNSLALAVPEPSTLALLGLGAIAGLVIVRRRAVKAS